MIMSSIRILMLSTVGYLGIAIGLSNITIDKELQPYYNDYVDQVKSQCKSSQYVTPRQLEIKFNNLEYPEIGVCKFNYFGRHIIEIDRGFWDRVSIIDKKTLFAHELVGHCMFHQGHSPNPNSFMYASFRHLSEEELNKQVTEYIKERCK